MHVQLIIWIPEKTCGNNTSCGFLYFAIKLKLIIKKTETTCINILEVLISSALLLAAESFFQTFLFYLPQVPSHPVTKQKHHYCIILIIVYLEFTNSIP